MQGLAQGSLESGGSTLPHLDGCLVCRACEPVCPAEVPYGRLIDAGRRGLWRNGHRPGWMWRALAFLRRTPRRLAWLTRLLRLSQRTGLSGLAAGLPLGRVARVAKFMQATNTPPSPGLHPAPVDTDENITLFLGCLARSLDAGTLHATVRVLNAMKFNVEIPSGQACCGAMDVHAGDRDAAALLAGRNLAAFGSNAGPVITTASGCGVQLKEYAELGIEGAEFLAARITDIMQFIAAHRTKLPPLASRNARVVVHSACSLKNGMREAGTLEVLREIPGLDVEPLRHQDCCGAAGSYLFEHADSADRLGAKLLDALGENIPDVFVTGNIGCALHVRRLAAIRGLRMQVLHPVQLLDACIMDSGGANAPL